VPTLAQVPLVGGAKIVEQVQQCDKGANAYCSLQLVAVNPRFRSAQEFADAERDLVKRKGWSETDAETGDEQAAESPGHTLRVTFATAYGDLKGIDVGWIHRSRKIAYALSRALFARSPAISVELDRGSS
jgi:hypothetical protein